MSEQHKSTQKDELKNRSQSHANKSALCLSDLRWKRFVLNSSRGGIGLSAICGRLATWRAVSDENKKSKSKKDVAIVTKLRYATILCRPHSEVKDLFQICQVLWSFINISYKGEFAQILVAFALWLEATAVYARGKWRGAKEGEIKID